MRTLIPGLLTSFALLPTLACGDILLEKTTGTGMVPESYALRTRCTLDSNGQLELHYQLSDLTSHRVQQMQLSVLAINRVISEAAAGKVSDEAFPVDGPSSSYVAYRKNKTTGATQQIVLFSEDGGSGNKSVNDAPAALKLKNFLDLNCDGALQY